MNIWIINHHALTPAMSGGTRHYDFAKELIKRGHEVNIFASSYHYVKYMDLKIYSDKPYLKESIDGVNFVWFKTYPYYSNGVKRVVNMVDFMQKVIKYVPKMGMKKPDIIIGSSVHLFAVYAGYKLSLKYKTPFVMEVRDLWPQTLIDLGMSKWHPFVVFLGFMERFLYKRADLIISNLPYAYEYIQNYAPKEKFLWISNGVDVKNIQYKPREKSDKFIISYAGAIGVANNLDLLVEVARELSEYEDIEIQIVGEGPEKNRLIDKMYKYGLKNIFIKKSVPKQQVYEILSNSDILYISILNSPLYKYGISMNKLYDYMASGRVVVVSGDTRNNPVKDSKVGYVIEPNSIGALKDMILEIYELPQEKRDEIGQKIRIYAERNYSIEVLVDKLEKCLLSQFNKKKVKF